MKLLFGLALSVLANSNVMAAAQAPDFTVTTEMSAGHIQVVATPPPGHHINVKAPMELEDLTRKKHIPASATNEKRTTFKLSGLEPRELTVRLFLCDDANKYCERHEVHLKWDGKAAAPEASAAPAPNKTPHAQNAGAPGPAKPGKSENGFTFNDPKAALAQAAANNQPLLIDFFGIWCPPCNMLDEEVFSKPAFKKAAANFVKLKLDADAPVSWELKAKYRVSGYPTVILATSDGEEISRVVGYRPLPEFLASVSDAWQQRSQTYVQLREKADAGDAKASAKVGLIHLQRMEYELAQKYLEKSADHREQLYDARIGVLEAGLDKEKLTQVLIEAVREFPDTVESIDRRMKLADLYEAAREIEKQKVQLGAVILTANLLALEPEKLVGHDALPADLLSVAAGATEKFGTPEQARMAWKRSAAEYRAQLARQGKAKAATERGYNIELAYCLWKSGDVAAAETLYQRLELKYPREFTFYYGHARMNLELKKLVPARELAARAFEYSYGDNRLRAGQLLAQAYVAEGNKKEGLEVVRKTLASTTLPEDKGIRTHRYVQKLKDLEASLSQGL
ncbi:MAG: thioredoxin family protein [Deltaproteobacteria bacterium]|nr:thioredoxin family protein [Deltaproteobacteria bacterium]